MPSSAQFSAARTLLALTALGVACTLIAAPADRFNLADDNPLARFPVTDLVWPAAVGEAAICLWHDDRLAALSITIDDNCAPDIPWWREKAAAHDFRATWFVITGRVSGSNTFNGAWSQFQQLLDEGHGVESHTVEHLHTDKPGPDGAPWSIEWEYAGSLRHLHENLSGPRATALAYPGGANKALNDRTLAARLYRSARGGSGTINPANRIAYLNINGMSGFNFGETSPDRKPAPWADLNGLTDRSVNAGRSYRGWAVVLAHLVNDKARPRWETLFAHLDARREQLWVGLFSDVAKYGQQRDTARISVVENTDSRIQFLLTDEMDDAHFDHPLTVKLRVPDAWPSVSAVQAGRPAPARRVVHEGAAYALVRAVPDRGPVTCTP